MGKEGELWKILLLGRVRSCCRQTSGSLVVAEKTRLGESRGHKREGRRERRAHLLSLRLAFFPLPQRVLVTTHRTNHPLSLRLEGEYAELPISPGSFRFRSFPPLIRAHPSPSPPSFDQPTSSTLSPPISLPSFIPHQHLPPSPSNSKTPTLASPTTFYCETTQLRPPLPPTTNRQQQQ